MEQKKLCEELFDVSEKLIGQTRRTCTRYGMLPRGSRVLVAFSGGADSTALLSVLSDLSGELGIEIGAFHLEHGIRGEESLSDERHCRQFCLERGIMYGHEHVSVPDIAAESGEGIEEAARRIRYDRLYSYCREHGYDRIATAHHADDNIETVIFRIARGTGLHGLCGIPPVRMMSDIQVIRPLIECDRSEIEEYLRKRSLVYVTDSTNNDESYSRNRIRHSVIPELKRINPSLSSAVARLCAQATLTEQAMESAASLSKEVFEGGMPEALLGMRLAEGYRDYVRKEGNIRADMLEAVHIEAMTELYKNGALWGRVSLPGNVSAVKTRNGIEFSPDLPRRDRCGEEKTESLMTELHMGWNPLPHGDAFYISEDENGLTRNGFPRNIKNTDINIYKLSIHISVNCAKLKNTVFCRIKEDGDRIRHGGMTKRVKKLFSEKKLSPDQRQTLPILCDGDGIVWIPGIALRDGMKCSETEKAVNIFYFSSDAVKSLSRADIVCEECK